MLIDAGFCSGDSVCVSSSDAGETVQYNPNGTYASAQSRLRKFLNLESNLGQGKLYSNVLESINQFDICIILSGS